MKPPNIARRPPSYAARTEDSMRDEATLEPYRWGEDAWRWETMARRYLERVGAQDCAEMLGLS